MTFNSVTELNANASNSSAWTLDEVLFTAFSCLGLLGAALSVFLIVVTKSYHRFGHRIILYFALASAWISASNLLHLSPRAVIYWAFLLSYGMLVWTSLLVWVATSACITTFFGVHALREKEKIVVAMVIVAPLLACWIPSASMKLSTKPVRYAGFPIVAAFCGLLGSVSAILLGAAMAKLCRCRYSLLATNGAPNLLALSLKLLLPLLALSVWTQVVATTLMLMLPLTQSADVLVNGYTLAASALITSKAIILFVSLFVDLIVCGRRRRDQPNRRSYGRWTAAKERAKEVAVAIRYNAENSYGSTSSLSISFSV